MDRFMRLARSSSLWIGVSVALLASLVAALRVGARALDATHLQDLNLSVASVRRVVSSADSLHVEYFVRNSGRPIRFTNLPEAYEFTVIDPGGRRLKAQWIADYEPPVLGTRADVLIPRGGAIGQRVNLACFVSGYYDSLPSAGWCGWGFRFTTRGEYRVIVRYIEPREGGVVMESDTARLVFQPER